MQSWVRQVRDEAYVVIQTRRMTGAALALTPGEPAGIGPDVALAAASLGRIPFVAFADPDVLRRRAGLLGVEVDSPPGRPGDPPGAGDPAGRAAGGAPHRSEPRRPRPAGPGETPPTCSTASVRRVAACRSGSAAGLVTAPVHKGIINDAGTAFTGHTEFLADLDGGARPVMMLCTSGLKVALATTHLPLQAVPGAIGPAMLIDTVRVVERDLRTPVRDPGPPHHGAEPARGRGRAPGP